MSITNKEVKYLADDKLAEWDKFVENHTHGTFFHKAGWKTVIEKSFGHKTYFLYIEKDGVFEGVLPLGYVKSRLFGSALISNPFCVYGGPLCNSEYAMNELTNAAAKLAEKLKVDYLEMRNRDIGIENWPIKDLYVTFRKEIFPDSEKNMMAIPRKQRAMVRKGIKAGLTSKIEPTVDNLYAAYSESVRNLGTPVFPKKYFQNLKSVFGESCECLVIYGENGQLVSGVMSFYFKDEVLPYYGGGTSHARNVKGNDFMYWELMRRAGENGVRIFDYGRSKKDTGSYSFKKNWGFEPEPLYYQFKLVNANELPDINPLNPKYQIFIKLWKQLPLPVTRLVGPMIAKNLG